MRPKKTTGKYGVESLPYYNNQLNYVDLVEFLNTSKDFRQCFQSDLFLEGHDFTCYTFADLYDCVLGCSPVGPDKLTGSYQYGLYSRDGLVKKRSVTIMGRLENRYGMVGTTVLTILFSNNSCSGYTDYRSFWSTFYEYRYLVRSKEGCWDWQFPSVDHTNLIEMANKLRDVL